MTSTDRLSHSSRPHSFDQPLKIKTLNPYVNVVLSLLAALALAGAAGGIAYAVTHQILPIAASAGGTVLVAGPLTFVVIRCLSHNRSLAKIIKIQEEKDKVIRQVSDKKEQERNFVEKGSLNEIQSAFNDQSLTSDPTQLLQLAAEKGQHEVVAFLLEKGADPRKSSNDHLEYSALHLAVICHEHEKGLKTMEVLLAKDATLVNTKAKDNATPLHHAASRGIAEKIETQKQKVQLLLTCRAEINAKDDKQNTPLHEAITGTGFDDPNIEVIALLTLSGADWNAANHEGKTPKALLNDPNLQTWLNQTEIQNRLRILGVIS